MKSVFEATTREELAKRVNTLTEKSTAQWGQMNVFQMMKHCVLADEMMTGHRPIKRVFIGRLIGRMVLNKALKGDKPFGRNSPTSPLLKTTHETGDVEQQKQEWINSIHQYANYKNPTLVHPFFGPMTRDEIGVFVYKHADHHLRQMGA